MIRGEPIKRKVEEPVSPARKENRGEVLDSRSDAGLPLTEKGGAGGLRYIPPEPVAASARKGLALRQKFHRGGTTIGVARARDLKDRKPLSDETMKRMAAFFAHHDVNGRAENFGNDDDPSAGYVAWLLWGGDAGRAWVEGQRHSRRQRPVKPN